MGMMSLNLIFIKILKISLKITIEIKIKTVIG